jgi:predicted Zn-dependent protease
VLRLKGRLEVEEGALDSACKTFKRLTQLQPTDPSVAVAYSDVLLVSQKYHKCIKYSESGRKKFPGQSSLLLNQARCHLFLGSLDVAAGLLATVG